MNNNVRLDIDTTELRRLVYYFTHKDWLTVKRRAIGAAARQLRNTAKQIFRQRLPAATKRSNKYSDRLIDAVRQTKIKNKGEGELFVSVHTLGSRKKTSGTFRARFFEGGTQDRYQKPHVDSLGRRYTHKKYIGRIKPLNFFRDANAQAPANQQRMIKLLTNEVNKLNNKKY